MLLVCNDFGLKRAARHFHWIAPLSGKLSDFSGLIVASVLCAVVARRFTRQNWLGRAGFSAPIFLFVGLKISVAMADEWVAFWGTFGVPCRIYRDPTDLLSLVVLPLAYRITVRPRPWTPVPLAKLGAVLGAFACIATSSTWTALPQPPGLRNATESRRAFAIRYLASELSCDAASAGVRAVEGESFSEVHVVELESGEFVLLTPPPSEFCDSSRDAAATAADAGTSSADAGAPCALSQRALDARHMCGAALVSADLLAPTLITWDLRGTSATGESPEKSVPPGVVYMERFGDELRASPGLGTFVFEWGALAQ